MCIISLIFNANDPEDFPYYSLNKIQNKGNLLMFKDMSNMFPAQKVTHVSDNGKPAKLTQRPE